MFFKKNFNSNDVIKEWKNEIRPKINEFLDACKDENTLKVYLEKDKFQLLDDIELFAFQIINSDYRTKKYFADRYGWMRDAVFKNYYTHHNKIFNWKNSTYENCKNDYIAIHELLK